MLSLFDFQDNLNQYFGTLGSILSAQAKMPPLRFLTFSKPASFKNFTALALRPPALQCTTISDERFNSCTRFSTSANGIRTEFGIRQISNSLGSRTSKMTGSSLPRILSFNSVTEISFSGARVTCSASLYL